MIYRKSFENFSPAYLERYHDIVLYDVFHHIQAFLLYPHSGECEDLRQKIILELNLDYYNKAERDNFDQLMVIKSLLEIPDDPSLRKQRREVYPLWLIRKDLKQKDIQFKMVDRLGWSLLRLAKSNEVYFHDRNAGVYEAIDLILGHMPLKSKANSLKKDDHLGGQKKYVQYLNDYKPVCHFIMAFQHMGGDSDCFPQWTVEKIDQFLGLCLWFGCHLFEIERTNSKEALIFPEGILIRPPDWVDFGVLDLPIEPYEEKRLKYEKMAEESEADYARRYGDSA
jgi:hypothetical protein